MIRLDDVTSRVRIESMMVQTEKMLSVGGIGGTHRMKLTTRSARSCKAARTSNGALPRICRRTAPSPPLSASIWSVSIVIWSNAGVQHFLDGIREAGVLGGQDRR